MSAEMTQVSEPTRIVFLDGFRGIAILLVLGFHYFSRFGTDPQGIYPYDDLLAGVPLFEYGFYGVQLFFSVSGFVIAMTLERTQGLVEFAVRRFARLWPAMALCSTLSYLVLWRWPLFWHQEPINFLPSLTFIDGGVWGSLSPAFASQWIDGAYWTLFVEVRFYFYAGLLYFLSRRKFAMHMLAFVVIVVSAYAACRIAGEMQWAWRLQRALIAPYLPWFLGGLAAFEAWRGHRRLAVALGVASVGLLGWLDWLNSPDTSVLVAVTVAAMFVSGLYWAPARRLFSMRWLTLVGVSSYSLYLLHQMAGVTLIAVLAEHLNLQGSTSLWLAPLVAFAMAGLAYLVYRYWEHPLNRLIVRAYARRMQRPAR